MQHEEIDRRVSEHYGWSGLMERIEQELRNHGIDPLSVTANQLAPVDNYHSQRLAGTLALAHLAAISRTDRVLDVGGGIGGPARQLATRIGCQMVVLDITSEYCAVGETLTRWTRLADRVSFVCGNALTMPFPDSSFDVVWTQHASMNIAQKARYYGEMSRVVRRGGRLALFDVLAGPNQPIHFPVPWASEQSFSFLLRPEDTRTLITQAGFHERVWLTGEELRTELDRSDASSDDDATSVKLNPGLLNGSNAQLMGANVQRNHQEGRITLAMGVFERA